MNIKEVWDIAKESFREWQEDKAARLAAAVSFYTIFSLAPLLVVLVGILGLVLGGQEGAQQVLLSQIRQATGGRIGAEGGLLTEVIQNASVQGGAGLATIIGIGVLLFGASTIFAQLQDAMNSIWEVKDDPNAGWLEKVKDRALAFVMVLGIGLILLVFFLVNPIIVGALQIAADFLPGSAFIFPILNLLISAVVFTLCIALVYKYLPDVKIDWEDVLLGAAVTAVLLAIGNLLIGIYLGFNTLSSIYAGAGSLVVILLWVFFASQIFFFGAEFTQVYARRHGKQVVPEKGAVRLTEAERAKQGMPHEGAEKREPLAGQSPAAVQAYQADPFVAYGAQREKAKRVIVPVEQPKVLPPAEPSILAFSAVLATLVGFVSGLVIQRGSRTKG